MAGNCIIDDEVCQEASRKEIIRRYFKCLCDQKTGGIVKDDRYKLELLLNRRRSVGMRAVEQQAHACSDKNRRPPRCGNRTAGWHYCNRQNRPAAGRCRLCVAQCTQAPCRD